MTCCVQTYTGGEDFTSLDNFLVTFDVGSTNGSQACAYIAIEDDNAFESGEGFDVMVSTGAEDNIIIDPPSTVTVTIDDDEGVCVLLLLSCVHFQGFILGGCRGSSPPLLPQRAQLSPQTTEPPRKFACY